MNTETKTEATRALSCRHHAHEIAEQVSIAHYMQAYENPYFHLQRVHESFARLAEILGYKIERIEK